MAFYSGKTGFVFVNGTQKPLTDWSLDLKVDSLDVTNFMSGGNQELMPGIFSCDLSASGPYDGYSMVNHGGVTTFTLGYGGGSAVVTALVTSVKVDDNVKDVVKISYTATSTGSIGFSP